VAACQLHSKMQVTLSCACGRVRALTENDEKKVDEQRSGSGGGTGDSVRPSADPEVEPSVEGEHPMQEIPIGIPMDPEEFKRLKSQAEQPAREEEGQAEADEDASTTQGD
jgi:hypothetical protein